MAKTLSWKTRWGTVYLEKEDTGFGPTLYSAEWDKKVQPDGKPKLPESCTNKQEMVNRIEAWVKANEHQGQA